MPVRLSGKEIVKALGKGGWELERVTGSHHVTRHADGRHVSVPVHGARPLPAGTLAAICRQVGRSASELRDLLLETDGVCHYRLHGGLWSHTHQVCGALLVVDKETVTCALNLRSHHPAFIDAGLPSSSGLSRDGAEASSTPPAR